MSKAIKRSALAAASAVFVASLLLSGAGCTVVPTDEEADSLREELVRLGNRVEGLEKALDEAKTELAAQSVRLGSVARLDGDVLDARGVGLIRVRGISLVDQEGIEKGRWAVSASGNPYIALSSDELKNVDQFLLGKWEEEDLLRRAGWLSVWGGQSAESEGKVVNTRVALALFWPDKASAQEAIFELTRTGASRDSRLALRQRDGPTGGLAVSTGDKYVAGSRVWLDVGQGNPDIRLEARPSGLRGGASIVASNGLGAEVELVSPTWQEEFDILGGSGPSLRITEPPAKVADTNGEQGASAGHSVVLGSDRNSGYLTLGAVNMEPMKSSEGESKFVYYPSTEQIELRCSRESGPSLKLSDLLDRVRIELGPSELITTSGPGRGTKTTRPISSIVLFDEEGQVTGALP